MFVVPLILLSLSLISGEVAGFFLGTNAAYLLIIRKGLPEDTGSKGKRVLRVFITLIIFGLTTLVLDIGFDTLGMAGYTGIILIEFLKSFFPAFTIWISVNICVKLNLYRRVCK
ncbi:hypothetical protein SDC9_203659 [bioreactor metagenome]|uniref:Uncharacterized protein n=1 Tax=bioreactor metagenome TaxID=1076179 RepID=A0A645IX26_9ZZZZ